MKRLIIGLLSFGLITSCSKPDQTRNQLTLIYQMIGEKTWYLDYTQTINNGVLRTRTYVGQATYFINLRKDKTTLDSDGINGTYRLESSTSGVLFIVDGKTTNGTTITYRYLIESTGSNHLITSFMDTASNTVTKHYFFAK